MKQLLFSRFVTLVLLAGLLTPVCLLADVPKPRASNKRFIIAAHEWPPFSSRESRYFGLLPRIVSQVLGSQGIQVEFRFLPWADALNGLVTEEFDGALIWVMDDLKREAFIRSDTILAYRSGLYYRKNFPKPQSADDLLGFRIGLNPNYVYDAPSYRLMKSRSMIPVAAANDTQHFNHLLSGEIDFYLTPLLTSAPLLRNRFSPEQQKQLAYTSNLFKFPPSQLLVNSHREGSANFIREFNNSLKRLKNNGTLDRYINDLRFEKY